MAMSPQMRVADWLQANGLQSCTAVLADLGYDEGIDMLAESDNEEQQDMVNAVSIDLACAGCCFCLMCQHRSHMTDPSTQVYSGRLVHMPRRV
eukprot:COSAG02_NODE_2332_length_9118_cov_1.999556_3_plen_93_part_00